MKPFRLILFIVLVTILSSCNKKSKGDPRPRHYYTSVPDTNRFVPPTTNSNVNGYVYSYYPNSNVVSNEGNYQRGVPSGYWKSYYADGKLYREGNYENGRLSGYWKFYYPNGLKQEEGNYQNNVKSGNWIYYYPNGTISSEGNYTNGSKQGEWSYYNEEGSLNTKTSY